MNKWTHEITIESMKSTQIRQYLQVTLCNGHNFFRSCWYFIYFSRQCVWKEWPQIPCVVTHCSCNEVESNWPTFAAHSTHRSKRLNRHRAHIS